VLRCVERGDSFATSTAVLSCAERALLPHGARGPPAAPVPGQLSLFKLTISGAGRAGSAVVAERWRYPPRSVVDHATSPAGRKSTVVLVRLDGFPLSAGTGGSNSLVRHNLCHDSGRRHESVLQTRRMDPRQQATYARPKRPPSLVERYIEVLLLGLFGTLALSWGAYDGYRLFLDPEPTHVAVQALPPGRWFALDDCQVRAAGAFRVGNPNGDFKEVWFPVYPAGSDELVSFVVRKDRRARELVAEALESEQAGAEASWPELERLLASEPVSGVTTPVLGSDVDRIRTRFPESPELPIAIEHDAQATLKRAAIMSGIGIGMWVLAVIFGVSKTRAEKRAAEATRQGALQPDSPDPQSQAVEPPEVLPHPLGSGSPVAPQGPILQVSDGPTVWIPQSYFESGEAFMTALPASLTTTTGESVRVAGAVVDELASVAVWPSGSEAFTALCPSRPSPRCSSTRT